ncbi:MAG TPA: WHG domain-containing protein [Crenalkalicoccus sp.]|nr:WHG domain-containing protein [Crenalkalicoccus sp.]
MLSVSTSARGAYHHGALRAALLDAADALLDEGGAGAVSLREAARRAGVSATAPYRHFADKEALLAALAARGFEAFGAALAAAAAEGPKPLLAMGLAYVRFALARPGRFRLMFGPGIADRARYPELLEAQRRAFGHLAAATGGGGRPDAPSTAAVAAWAQVHGLAQLILDGMLPVEQAEALTQAVTAMRHRGEAVG